MKKNKKISVLLINPPVSSKDVYGQYSHVAPKLPPLGLCYLAATLIENGFNSVKIIDCLVDELSFVDLEILFCDCNPDVVGVTANTPSFWSAKKVVEICKAVNPKIFTVLGGPHITALPKKCLRECPDLDLGICGEGEKTFLELIRKISENESYSDLRGIVYRKKNKIIKNDPSSIINDLDKIPFPARNLLKDFIAYKHTPLRGVGNTASVITSRGCPYNCSFCDQSVFGRKWRCHSAEYVYREIVNLINLYQVNFISFEDDNFLISRDRVVELCRLIEKLKKKIFWGCSARLDNLDDELLNLMKKSGCYNIFVGIESGSSRLLKLTNKGLTLNQINEGISKIKKAGIRVYGSLILGLPTETRSEMKNSINFVKSLPLDGISVFLFTPYPNTELGKIAERFGSVSYNWRDYSSHSSQLPYIPEGFSAEEMLQWQRRAYLEFYIRPGYILRNFTRLLDYDFLIDGANLLKNQLLDTLKYNFLKKTE